MTIVDESAFIFPLDKQDDCLMRREFADVA